MIVAARTALAVRAVGQLARALPLLVVLLPPSFLDCCCRPDGGTAAARGFGGTCGAAPMAITASRSDGTVASGTVSLWPREISFLIAARANDSSVIRVGPLVPVMKEDSNSRRSKRPSVSRHAGMHESRRSLT